MCWGDNRWGELGDGTTTERAEPVAVKRLKGDIEQIVAGQHHTCAIVDGGARCWGHGSYGQLGDGTKRSPVTTPVQVRGLTKGVTSMALGIFTTCAIVDGHVKCWGMNTSGELGLEPRTNRTIPVDAPAAGDDFLGVRSEGFDDVRLRNQSRDLLGRPRVDLSGRTRSDLRSGDRIRRRVRPPLRRSHLLPMGLRSANRYPVARAGDTDQRRHAPHVRPRRRRGLLLGKPRLRRPRRRHTGEGRSSTRTFVRPEPAPVAWPSDAQVP